jgi:hypothetical protein
MRILERKRITNTDKLDEAFLLAFREELVHHFEIDA